MSWKKGNRLPLVRESEAQGRVQQIYQEIKQALGVPHVNVVFQAYATYPVFFEMHWNAIRPAVLTRLFFDIAERLRADAYTRMHNYFSIPDLCARTRDMQFSSGAQHELADVIDLFHYNNSLLLLITSAQMQAFDGPIGEAGNNGERVQHPVFSTKPILIDEQQAPAPTKKLFDDIKRVMSMPVVNTDYRAFARWPDFLTSYWHVAKPVRESPIYQQSQFAVRESAWQLARELPGPIELTISQLSEAGMTDDDIASVVRMTELFTRSLSAQVLDVAIAKIGIEGGNVHKRTELAPETAQPKVPERAA